MSAMHPWHDVELPRFVEDVVPAIIEIPTGSKVKYELDKASGLLIVDRILFSAVHYPANYGFVPRTYCDDGDPLDILVYCQEPIQSLAIMRAKVIGVMEMRDDKGEDDKLIAVYADDPEYVDYADVSEMPAHRMRELKRSSRQTSMKWLPVPSVPRCSMVAPRSIFVYFATMAR
jgi:inorganic pyrophosphatase